jgi:hypothetical protein
MMTHLLWGEATTGTIAGKTARSACDNHTDLITKPFIPKSASQAGRELESARAARLSRRSLQSESGNRLGTATPQDLAAAFA